MTEPLKSVRCRVCAGNAIPHGQALMLGKYPCAYFRCGVCGFIQTEAPYWLEEAYSEAINLSDVGLVQRNQRLARIARALIAVFFDGGGRFVDFGGGYGLFVRMMRDAGYDFYRYDAHCANLLARGFEAEPEGGYELLTAFEVFEHLVDPVAEVERMLGFSESILFTTELLPEVPPRPGGWSYFGLDHGQHVSFFTRRALELLGDRFGLSLYTDGKFRHLLTRRRLSASGFRLLSLYKVAALLAPFTGRPSLTPVDFERITGNRL